jgi:hypothetical protein
LRKLAAAVAVVFGLSGLIAAATPSASADPLIDLHERVNAPPSDPSNGLCLLRLYIAPRGGTPIVNTTICI